MASSVRLTVMRWSDDGEGLTPVTQHHKEIQNINGTAAIEIRWTGIRAFSPTGKHDEQIAYIHDAVAGHVAGNVYGCSH